MIRRRWGIWIFLLLVISVSGTVILLALSRGHIATPPTFELQPAEIALSPGQGWQFRATHDGRIVSDLSWRATGGVIGPRGFYAAPDEPGSYVIWARHPNGSHQAMALVEVIDLAPSATPIAMPAPPTLDALTVSPTPPAVPAPTATPLPTSAPTPTPIPKPTVTPPPPEDRSGDLFSYTTLAPVTNAPPGSDIRASSFDGELHLLQPVPEDRKADLTGWDMTQDVIIWIALYEPIPDPVTAERSWLAALDTDGDPTTGRPLGEGVINPDIGAEITLGVQSAPDRGGALQPYLFIWDVALGDSVRHTEGVEARLSANRTAVLIRTSKDALNELLRSRAGIEPDWTAARGRAAAMIRAESGLVMDVFPDLP